MVFMIQVQLNYVVDVDSLKDLKIRCLDMMFIRMIFMPVKV